MTDREFDAFVRAHAQREALSLTEQSENKIKTNMAQHGAVRRVWRLSLRTALTTALVLMLLTVTALAVANLPGVADLMEKIGWGGQDAADHIKAQTAQPQGTVYQLPDVDITLSELVYDGSHLYAALRMAPRADSNAVLLALEYGPSNTFGINEFRGERDEAAPTNAEVARERGARLLYADVNVDALRGATGTLGGCALDCWLNPDGSVDFVFDLDDIYVNDSGAIEVTLTGFQVEVSPENVRLRDTEVRAEWQLTIPALARTICVSTPTPTATPVPADAADGALRVYGISDAMIQAAMSAEPQQKLVWINAPATSFAEDIAAQSNALTDACRDTEKPLTVLSQPMPESGTLSAAQWDVCCLSTKDPLFKTLIAQSALYDLSADAALAAWQEKWHAPIREAVTADGKVIAFPIQLWADLNSTAVLTSRQRFDDLYAFEQLGFIPEDRPETLHELFTLAQRYAALPKAQRRDIIFCEDAANARAAFTELVLNLYVSEHGGAPVTFQNETLRALLTQAVEAADALKAEKPFGHRVLHNCGLLQAAENAVPLRLTTESPIRVYANMNVLVINAQSPRIEQALQFVAAVSNAIEWEMRARLDKDVSFDELNELAIVQEIAQYEMMAADCLTAAEAETNASMRKSLKADAEACLATADELRAGSGNRNVIETPYLTYREDLAAYRENLAPYLNFTDGLFWGYALPDSAAAYALENKYLAGKLDVTAFLKGLDELLDQ